MNRGCHPWSTTVALWKFFPPFGSHDGHLIALQCPLHRFPLPSILSLPSSLYLSGLEVLVDDAEPWRPRGPSMALVGHCWSFSSIILSFPSFFSLFLFFFSLSFFLGLSLSRLFVTSVPIRKTELHRFTTGTAWNVPNHSIQSSLANIGTMGFRTLVERETCVWEMTKFFF